MTIAVLSDIHGNRQALEAVLKDIAQFNVDHIVNLGDTVGYGADPQWCVDTIREAASISLLGNHDVVAAQIRFISGFNCIALASLEWTLQNLSPEALEWFRSLPYAASEPNGRIGYVHASLPNPEHFDYLLNLERIEAHLTAQKEDLVFVGHTHSADCWSTDGNKFFSAFTFRNHFVQCSFGPDDRSFLNVGSVGQPRDGDPRASYVIVEESGSKAKITNRRVEYDVEAAQRRIHDAGLPEFLATRLEFGK